MLPSSATSVLGAWLSNTLGVATASMAYYSTIYGAGFTLTEAPGPLHRDALDRATGPAANRHTIMTAPPANFATSSECVAEKDRYVVGYGLVVMPLGGFSFTYYFEYMQEF